MWKLGEMKVNEMLVVKMLGELVWELCDGELVIKKGLFGLFIKEGFKEVTAEDY